MIYPDHRSFLKHRYFKGCKITYEDFSTGDDARWKHGADLASPVDGTENAHWNTADQSDIDTFKIMTSTPKKFCMSPFPQLKSDVGSNPEKYVMTKIPQGMSFTFLVNERIGNELRFVRYVHVTAEGGVIHYTPI